jgi:hypothetical protein
LQRQEEAECLRDQSRRCGKDFFGAPLRRLAVRLVPLARATRPAPSSLAGGRAAAAADLQRSLLDRAYAAGTGTITFGANNYLGVGKFGGVSDIDEDAQLRPSGVSVTLSGVDAGLVSSAVTEAYHGRAITIYQGFLNVSTGALVADPETVFKGLMDFMTVDLGQNTGSITVQCEGEMARWLRHNSSLYTHESQQALFAGDRGFDQIPFLQNRKIDWSKSNVWQSTSAQAWAAGTVSRMIGK